MAGIPNPMNPFQGPLELLIDAFTQLHIGYLVGGSVASSYHGRPRATVDVDILADLGPQQVGPFIGRLSEEFVAFEDEVLSAIKDSRSFNLIHRRTVSKFDIFLPRGAFDRSQLHRAKLVPFNSFASRIELFVASPEDVILAKLRWFRLGGETSERQWSDVRGVVEIQAGKLDLEYLNNWAQELRVQDLLARALR